MGFNLRSGNASPFKQMGSSPLKKHDGTKSERTHWTDGSAKSKREVFEYDETKTEEAKETKKGDANKGGGDYQKRHNQLLDQGFTPEDADKMIDSNAVTGRTAKTKTKKKKSPLKCPLVAALPAIMGAVGAVGGMMKKKKEE